MIEDLLMKRAESAILDVKEMFVDNEHGWIELVKDIVAFTNRKGGAIVFGVQDKTFKITGCNADAMKCLGDPNIIKQKLNKYVRIDIPIEVIIERIEGKDILAVLIRPMIGGIAVFDADGSYVNPSGATKCAFVKGQVVIRGDAGNEILSSINQNILREKLVFEERDRIISGITKVVTDPTGYRLVAIDKSEGKRVVFSGGDPTAHKITFDVDQTGRLYEDDNSRDALEMLRASARMNVEVDREIVARHIISMGLANALPVAPESVFCLACKCDDIPRFITIGYVKGFQFSEKVNRHFMGCSTVMQKGRLISAVKVIDKAKARELISLLKTEERRQLGGMIRIGTKQEEDDHSCILLSGIKNPLKIAKEKIEVYLKKIANGDTIDYNEGRKAIALDYLTMKSV